MRSLGPKVWDSVGSRMLGTHSGQMCFSGHPVKGVFVPMTRKSCLDTEPNLALLVCL